MNRKLIPKIVAVAECGESFYAACKSARLRSVNLNASLLDAVSEGVEKINPATLADVRELPKVLQLDGLLHLLAMEDKRHRGWYADWYYSEVMDDASVTWQILGDVRVKSIADVLCWLDMAADARESAGGSR